MRWRRRRGPRLRPSLWCYSIVCLERRLPAPAAGGLVAVSGAGAVGAAGPAGLGDVALPEVVLGRVRELLLEPAALAHATARRPVRAGDHPVVRARCRRRRLSYGRLRS